MRQVGIRFLLLLMLPLASASALPAKPWRGIEPLRSTRTDVIRQFNECLDQKEACTFTVDTEIEWKVSAGKIIRGQHTSRITVDVSGLPPQTLKIGAEVIDPDRYVAAYDECSIYTGTKGPEVRVPVEQNTNRQLAIGNRQ